jgi:ADP-ribose pyrophosphatase YjhB (NUDIX family)
MNDDPVAVNHHIQHRHPASIRFCSLCGGELSERLVLPDRRRHKVCAACGFVDFQGPKLVAGCLVIERGKVLLLRRAITPRLGMWTFPGGYVDLGETAEQAAVRETSEEAGMNVRIGRLFGIYFDPINAAAAVTVYLAEADGEPAATSDEASAIRYFTPDEIPWPEIAFRTTHQALRDWMVLEDLPKSAG